MRRRSRRRRRRRRMRRRRRVKKDLGRKGRPKSSGWKPLESSLATPLTFLADLAVRDV